MVRVPRRPLRCLAPLVATLTLVPSGCKTPCCPSVPPGEPVVQGTMRIDPVAQQATIELELGPGMEASGWVDLWVGPDPNADQGLLVMGTEGELVLEVPSFIEPGPFASLGQGSKRYDYECMPVTNPLRTRVWNYEGEDVHDILVVARIMRKFGGDNVAAFGHFVKYFEVPEEDYSWDFTGRIYPAQGQAMIGGEIGNDNVPLVGGVYDLSSQQSRFTFINGEFQAPTHGWRPQRAWIWRIASEDPPAWDDRSMHVDDAFWSTDQIPPLPAAFPTAGDVVTDNLVCQSGQRYWFYAIVEETKSGTTRYHAHRSGYSAECAAGPATPHVMLISPDSETTLIGPAGS